MEYLYTPDSLREQVGRLEADLARRAANGESEDQLADLRWRIQRLHTKIDAGSASQPRKR